MGKFKESTEDFEAGTFNNRKVLLPLGPKWAGAGSPKKRDPNPPPARDLPGARAGLAEGLLSSAGSACRGREPGREGRRTALERQMEATRLSCARF